MSVTRRILALALAATAIVGLAACAPTVDLEPAPDANNPLCAEVTTLLPGTLGGEQRRWTDAQATGAWGDPGAPTRIILACGVAVPGPTTLPCQPVDGVDWIIDDTDAPSYLVTTYGRSPAVQVYLDTEFVSSMDVLSALSGIVNALPRTGAACVDLPIEEG